MHRHRLVFLAFLICHFILFGNHLAMQSMTIAQVLDPVVSTEQRNHACLHL